MSWRLVVVGVAAIILHFLLHVGFGIGVLAPDLLTLALLVLAREIRVGGAAALGFSLGILEDALSLLSFGANTFSLAVVGALASITRDLFVGDSRLFLLSYLWIGKLVRDGLYWLLAEQGLGYGLVGSVVSATYLTAVGAFVLLLAGRWGES